MLTDTALISFTIGCAYKDDLGLTKNHAANEVATEAASVLQAHGQDGCSAQIIQGWWRGEAELSVRLDVVANISEPVIEKIAAFLAWKFKQECVMVTRSVARAGFIAPVTPPAGSRIE